MFTHATEGVSILSSLESVSTFGRVYLDEFIRPELTELAHFVSCIALMQMYFNDYSMIQTICAISTFFIAAIYQVLRILITPIIFIVRRGFYLSCAATNSRASRTFTRNNHEPNIERLDMILYNTASTSMFSTPFNVRFMSRRISSALDNFIVNGKRILIGYPGIENPSPSRVVITISKRQTNSYISDSSISHAKSLNILCDITRRGVGLQQEMFIRTYIITAMLPKEIFHTSRAYQMPMIEEGARITEIDETDVFTTANESASLSGLIEDCESVNAANEPISLESVPNELLLPEPFNVPEMAIIDEGARHISETVDILEPSSEPSLSISTQGTVPEKDSGSTISIAACETALVAEAEDTDSGLSKVYPFDCEQTEKTCATTALNSGATNNSLSHFINASKASDNAIVEFNDDGDTSSVYSLYVEDEQEEEHLAQLTAALTGAADATNSPSRDFLCSDNWTVEPATAQEEPTIDDDMEEDQTMIVHDDDDSLETSRNDKIKQASRSTCLRAYPPPIAAIMARTNPDKYIDNQFDLDTFPDGRPNPVFKGFIDRFFEDAELDEPEHNYIKYIPEAPRERVIYCLTTIRTLSMSIIQLDEELSTSRAGSAESSFRPMNGAARKDPMELLSYFCYNSCCNIVDTQHADDDSEIEMSRMFHTALYTNKIEYGKFHLDAMESVFEAYKYGASAAMSRNKPIPEQFQEDIQSQLSSFDNLEIEDCIRCINTAIKDLYQDLSILYKPSLTILRVYRPLKKVYDDYMCGNVRNRRNFYMDLYREFISWSGTKTAEQAHELIRQRMSCYTYLDEKKFKRQLDNLRWCWATSDEFIEDPTPNPRRRDVFRKIWRNVRQEE